MADKKSMINYEKRPIPSGPGSKQITINGQEMMKGGSDMTQPLPKDNLIPDSSKGWCNDKGPKGKGRC